VIDAADISEVVGPAAFDSLHPTWWHSMTNSSNDPQMIPPLSIWKHIGPGDSLSDVERHDLLAALRVAAHTDDWSQIEEVADRATGGDVDAMVALGVHYAKWAGPAGPRGGLTNA
jgi:hypothetical protein